MSQVGLYFKFRYSPAVANTLPGVGPLNEPAYLRVTGFYMVVVSVTCVTW